MSINKKFNCTRVGMFGITKNQISEEMEKVHIRPIGNKKTSNMCTLTLKDSQRSERKNPHKSILMLPRLNKIARIKTNLNRLILFSYGDTCANSEFGIGMKDELQEDF